MKSGAIIIEGHVQGLSNVRALGEMGISVYVIDTAYCLAQHSRYCRKFFKCPDYKSEEFIDFLIQLGKKECLTGWCLIPSNDHIVENLSCHKEILERYYKTIVPDIDILNNIINKKRILEVAVACGTPIPTTCYPDSIGNIDKLRFPVLIKGNWGLSFYKITHAKAILIDKRDDFEQILGNVLSKVSSDNIMVQELLPFDKEHKVVSFTCFAVDGIVKTFWMGEKLREHPIKYGTATCSKSVFIQQVLDVALPLVKALNYTGACEIEFLRDSRDGIYKLIEMNPRTWLWVGLAKACGINYAMMIYNHLNNIENDYAADYEKDIKWINWITDIVYAYKAIMKRELSMKEYFKSLKGKKVTAIFSSKDIMPGIMFPFMLLYIAKKRL